MTTTSTLSTKIKQCTQHHKLETKTVKCKLVICSLSVDVV